MTSDQERRRAIASTVRRASNPAESLAALPTDVQSGIETQLRQERDSDRDTALAGLLAIAALLAAFALGIWDGARFFVIPGQALPLVIAAMVAPWVVTALWGWRRNVRALSSIRRAKTSAAVQEYLAALATSEEATGDHR